MEQIDVAIQSYKKPESLIYTLLSLKKSLNTDNKNPEFYIDTVWIDDDLSGEDTIKHYKDERLINIMSPIKIKLRVNKYWYKPPHACLTWPIPPYFKDLCFREKRRYLLRLLTFKLSPEDDIRYQWAINNTKAKKLFIIHDDILFTGNIVKKYFDTFKTNSNLAIAGDLGRCFVCAHNKECNPEKIMNKIYPTDNYPKTKRKNPKLFKNYARICRINEWCCMLDVEKTRKIKAHFGNYIDEGDVVEYWFEIMIKQGYDFCDPLPNENSRKNYYIHAWQGHSGHSVWEDQGYGKRFYDKDMIINKLKEDFNYQLIY